MITNRKEEWGRITYCSEKDQFSAAVKKKHQPILSRPLGAGWMLTGRCNLNCIHCYGNREDHNAQSLTREESLRVVDRIAESGILRQTLSGGEPLLNKYVFDIIDALAAKGVAPILGTNGRLLDEHTVKKLRNCARVEISLDSAKPEINNIVRRGPNIAVDAFADARRAISLCQDAGLKVRVLTCLNRFNYKQIPALAELLHNLGIREWSISWTMNVGRSSIYYDALVPEDTVSTGKVVENLRELYPNMDIRYSNRTRNFNRFFCLISPDGKLGTSDFKTSRAVFYGSLLDKSISEFWNIGFYDIHAHFLKWVGERVIELPRAVAHAPSRTRQTRDLPLYSAFAGVAHAAPSFDAQTIMRL